jgi:hypothetical protein
VRVHKYNRRRRLLVKLMMWILNVQYQHSLYRVVDDDDGDDVVDDCCCCCCCYAYTDLCFDVNTTAFVMPQRDDWRYVCLSPNVHTQ